MKIREIVEEAAEIVLSELLVPNAAKELARQIGAQAEQQVVAALVGDVAETAAESATSRAATSTSTTSKRRKPRNVDTKTEAAISTFPSIPVIISVSDNAPAAQTPQPIQIVQTSLDKGIL